MITIFPKSFHSSAIPWFFSIVEEIMSNYFFLQRQVILLTTCSHDPLIYRTLTIACIRGGSVNLFCKVQTVNILGFAGAMVPVIGPYNVEELNR